MFSFWEKNTWFASTDICIVGSGIVGLNAAIHLKKSFPQKQIIVLERGMLPCGASTKNAGFACFGSPGELAADLALMGHDELHQLIKARLDGLHLLRQTLGDDTIAYNPCGGAEIFLTSDENNYENILNQLPAINHLMKDVCGMKNVFTSTDEHVLTYGFKNVKHIISNTLEGQIDTGLMMKALLQKAKECGISVFFGADVLQVNSTASQAEIEVAHYGKITADQVILSTNGFISQFMPSLNILPGRAQVLITEPITQLAIDKCFHYQEGYYYFRNVGMRILFGGGRNLDKGAETTTSHEISSPIQESLDAFLHQIIAPGINPKVEMRWAGTLGLGLQRKPTVKCVDDRIYVAAGMGGMGVALGSLTGKEVAELLVNTI